MKPMYPSVKTINGEISDRPTVLRNSLSAGIRLSTAETEKLLHAAGIDPQRRAETLSLDEWGRLSNLYREY